MSKKSQRKKCITAVCIGIVMLMFMMFSSIYAYAGDILIRLPSEKMKLSVYRIGDTDGEGDFRIFEDYTKGKEIEGLSIEELDKLIMENFKKDEAASIGDYYSDANGIIHLKAYADGVYLAILEDEKYDMLPMLMQLPKPGENGEAPTESYLIEAKTSHKNTAGTGSVPAPNYEFFRGDLITDKGDKTGVSFGERTYDGSMEEQDLQVRSRSHMPQLGESRPAAVILMFVSGVLLILNVLSYFVMNGKQKGIRNACKGIKENHTI